MFIKTMLYISILFFSIGCNNIKNIATIPSKLNGTWVPTKQEISGQALPNTIFEKQKLIINDSAYTLIAESVDKGIVRYNDHTMDIYGKEGVNKGKHFTAIYKIENEQLIICYNLKGDQYPETFETKGKALFFLSVFRKDNQ